METQHFVLVNATLGKFTTSSEVELMETEEADFSRHFPLRVHNFLGSRINGNSRQNSRHLAEGKVHNFLGSRINGNLV